MFPSSFTKHTINCFKVNEALVHLVVKCGSEKQGRYQILKASGSSGHVTNNFTSENISSLMNTGTLDFSLKRVLKLGQDNANLARPEVCIVMTWANGPLLKARLKS